MNRVRRAAASTAVVAFALVASPFALAQEEEPYPRERVPSDCCEPDPRCLDFRSGPRLAVHARRTDRVALDFELSRRPRSVTRVTIAGRAARIHALASGDGRAYRAILRRTRGDGRVAVGRRYAIRIDVELRPSRELCALSVPYGKDHTPPGGGTCSEGCSDAYVNRIRLHAKPRKRG